MRHDEGETMPDCECYKSCPPYKADALDLAWGQRDKLYAEGAKLRAEGNLVWAQAILDTLGNVPVKWVTGGCEVGGRKFVKP